MPRSNAPSPERGKDVGENPEAQAIDQHDGEKPAERHLQPRGPIASGLQPGKTKIINRQGGEGGGGGQDALGAKGAGERGAELDHRKQRRQPAPSSRRQNQRSPVKDGAQEQGDGGDEVDEPKEQPPGKRIHAGGSPVHEGERSQGGEAKRAKHADEALGEGGGTHARQSIKTALGAGGKRGFRP